MKYRIGNAMGILNFRLGFDEVDDRWVVENTVRDWCDENLGYVPELFIDLGIVELDFIDHADYVLFCLNFTN